MVKIYLPMFFRVLTHIRILELKQELEEDLHPPTFI